MIVQYSIAVLLGQVLGGALMPEESSGSGQGSGIAGCAPGFAGAQCEIECDCNGEPCATDDRFSDGYMCLCGGDTWWTNNMTGMHCDQECNCNGHPCEHNPMFYCDGDTFECTGGGEMPAPEYSHTCKCPNRPKDDVVAENQNTFERTCGASGYKYVCTGIMGDPWYKTWDTSYYNIGIQGYCAYEVFETGCDSDDLPYIYVVSQHGNLFSDDTSVRQGTYTIGLDVYYRPAHATGTYMFSSHKEAGKRWIENERPWKMQGFANPGSAIWTFPNQKFLEIAAATRQEGSKYALYLGIGVGDPTGATLQAWKDDTTNAPIEDYAFKIKYDYYHYVDACATELYKDCPVTGVWGNMNGAEDPGVEVAAPGQTDDDFYQSLTTQYQLSCESPGYNGVQPCIGPDCTGRKRRSTPEVSELQAEQASHSRERRQSACPNEAAYQAACAELDAGPFTACDHDTTSLIQNCVADACFLNDIEYTKCRTMEAFVSQCNADPSNQINSWRDTNRCPMICGVNAHYEPCTAPSCHASVSACTVDTNQCNADMASTCFEGCVCDDGFLMDAGGECLMSTVNNCVGPPAVNTAAMSACSVNPCLNGGVCTETGAATYTCACAAGFYGDTCENEGNYEIELTCNGDNTMDIVIKYGQAASLIGLGYGTCDRSQIVASQDINNDFNIQINPAACGLSASAVDAYHVTFQFGHEDNGMLLHMEDIKIAGSCPGFASEVSVEYDYGELTTNTEIHTGDGGSFTAEFEFTSYDVTYMIEQASTERAGEMIYLGAKLKSVHDANFGHAQAYRTGPGRVWAPKSCKVVDVNNNLEYMLFENDGTAQGCSNDLVLLAVAWHQTRLMWSIEHKLFLLGTETQSNFKLLCTLLICEHGTPGIDQCLDIINSC